MNCNFTTKNQNKIKSLLLTVAVVIFSCLAMSAWGQTTVQNSDGSFTIKYETPGSYNWTPPTNISQVLKIEAWGAGGGGNATSSANRHGAGSGGGGGAYSANTTSITGLTSSASFSITVGSGGSGGSDGSASKVVYNSSTKVNAGGGKAGVNQNGKGDPAGGAGGTASDGTTNTSGYQGGSAHVTNPFTGIGGSYDGGAGGASGNGSTYGRGGDGAERNCWNIGTSVGASGANGAVWITYTIKPNTANAGSDGFICGHSGQLWASHVLTSDTMYHPVWSCTSSDVTITNAGSANATVTLNSGVALPATRTFIWTYNASGSYSGSSDQVQVTFNDCDPAGCLATGTIIFKEDFGGNNASDPNFSPSGLPDGITTLEYHPNKVRVPEGSTVKYGIYNLIKDGMTNSGWSEPGDHTSPGDNTRGYFMEIDGRGGGFSDQFYQQTISGLCQNTLLYFTYWLVNVNSEGQTQLELVIKDHDGNILRQQSTGVFNNTSWTQQGTVFTVPVGVDEVTFYLINNEGVESGNDFGLDDIEVRLCTAPAYASFDGPNTICYGGTTTLQGQYTDDGRSFLAPSYQWFSSADGSNWTAISGATSLNYTVANATSSMYYRLAVAGSAEQVADETSNCRFCPTLFSSRLRIRLLMTMLSHAARIFSLCLSTFWIMMALKTHTLLRLLRLLHMVLQLGTARLICSTMWPPATRMIPLPIRSPRAVALLRQRSISRFLP